MNPDHKKGSLFGGILEQAEPTVELQAAELPQAPEAPPEVPTLTSTALRLPPEARTVEQFALTLCDLFGEQDLAVLIQRMRSLKTKRAGTEHELNSVRPVRLVDAPVEMSDLRSSPPWLGYEVTVGGFEPLLASMVWDPRGQVVARALPSAVHTKADACRIIGCNDDWAQSRLSSARRRGSEGVLLISRDGTRAVSRSALGGTWTVHKEPLKPQR